MNERLRGLAVLLDDRPHSDARLELAIAAASAFGADLDGIYVTMPAHDDHDPGADAYARGPGIDDAIAHVLDGERGAAARQRATLHAAAAQLGFVARWRELSTHETLPSVATTVGSYDLLFLPPVDAAFDAAPWSPADLVFVAGVAGVVVPRTPLGPSFGRRVAIAWNASHVARRAVADAMPLLGRADAVEILIIDDARDRGVDGAELRTLLERHGVATTLRHVRAAGRDVADALLEGFALFDADLVVAGAYGHARWSQIVFGSTTRRLLRRTGVPILIAH